MIPKFRFFHHDYGMFNDPDLLNLNNGSIKYDSDWYDVKDGILMQSTGLKDANGVEIYEGDVLNYGDYKKSHEVIFRNGCFWGHAIGEKEQIGIGLFNALEDLEVCGNIHENPELLKEDTTHG